LISDFVSFFVYFMFWKIEEFTFPLIDGVPHSIKRLSDLYS
jgi:hypothetical protein